MSASAVASLPRVLLRALLLFFLTLHIATSALAQGWRKNPRIDDDLGGNPSNVVCFELLGRAFAVQEESGAVRVHWTSPGGFHRTVAPANWTDGNGQPIPVSAVHAACRIGERDFFLAYEVLVAGFLLELRVARLQWDVSGTVTTVAGPVTIHTGAQNIDMVLRETSSGTDGVMLAWQGGGNNGPIRVQGVSQSGSTLSTTWGLPPSSSQPSHSSYPPSIVSTGDGLGVVTYMRNGGTNDNDVWAMKHDVAGAPIFDQLVPGQTPGVDLANPDFHAVSDGAGGAFFSYSTLRDIANDGSTDFMNARIGVTWNGSAWVVAQSASLLHHAPNSLDGTRMRSLAMIAMPSSTAMVVYRDQTAIRAYRLSTNLSAMWMVFVRGADLTNDDECDALLSPAGPVLVVSANDDVMAKHLDSATGQPIWNHQPTWNEPPRGSEIPVNNISGQPGNSPRRPHIFATGDPDTRGFLVSWYDDLVGGRQDHTGWFAERLRSDGKRGKKAHSPFAGTAGFVNDAVLLDAQSSGSYVELDSLILEVGDNIGTQGSIEVWTRIGQTHQGHENASDWTLAAATDVVVGSSIWIEVDMIPPVFLPPGTSGIAIRGVGVSLRTSAVGVPTSFGSSTDGVTFTSGSVVAGWQGGAVQPGRILSGALSYRLLDGPGIVGTSTSVGIGCGSAGPLVLSAPTRPVLGSTMALHTNSGSMNPTLGFVVLGFTPMPALPLDFLGMPGCQLYQSLDQTYFLASTFGSMTLSLSLPNDPYLSGAAVYAQSALRDPFGNSFGLAASNGLTLILGDM